MQRLTDDYQANVELLSRRLGVDKSFDLICRRLPVGEDELTLFYIDGFVKDGVTQRLMQFYLSQKGSYIFSATSLYLTNCCSSVG